MTDQDFSNLPKADDIADFMPKARGGRGDSFVVTTHPDHKWCVVTAEKNTDTDPDSDGSVGVQINKDGVLSIAHKVGGEWKLLMRREMTEAEKKGMFYFDNKEEFDARDAAKAG